MRSHRTRIGVSVTPETTGSTGHALARARVGPPPRSRRATAAARRQEAARRIDDQLFRPGSWLMLDAANGVVPGVRPGTLDQALALVGQGAITSFFGRLRSGVVAVDIDMVRSAGPVMALAGWCAEREVWHLVRASGRRGHAHVFVVVGDRRAELEAFVVELRSAEGVSRTRIDVREAIRPLCAPHRAGTTPALPPVARAAARLPRALATLSDGPGLQRPTRPPTQPALRTDGPGPRRRTGLPGPWQRYLREGVAPPQVAGWPDQSRSAVESTATFHMVRAGWSSEQAWLAITTCHRAAMTKARERGRRWWTLQVWNPAAAAVATSDEQPAPPPRGVSPPQDDATGLRVAQVRSAFLAAWNRYGRERRHTLRFVLETVTDRMLRAGSPLVPCPERDLVVDCGVTSRRVVREALRDLDAQGWVVLHRTFVPGSDQPGQRSHHVSLPEVAPSPTPPTLFAPPRPFTPLERDVRAHLGPRAWHTWADLPLLHRGGSDTPVRRSRSEQARLVQLASIGLARVDASGGWWGLPVPRAAGGFLAEARRAREHRVAAVAAERAEYDLVRTGSRRWAAERAVAITRSRAARHRGAQAWWSGLPGAERERRGADYTARFAALDLAGQGAVKDELARRRAACGVSSEDAVNRAWLAALDPGEYTERVISRTMAYRALPAPLRAARAAAWADHRARWGIVWHAARASTVPGSGKVSKPAAQFAGLEQLELLALGEVLDRDATGTLSGVDHGPPVAAPDARGTA